MPDIAPIENPPSTQPLDDAAIAGILLNALLPGNDYQFDEGSNEPESASLRV